MEEGTSLFAEGLSQLETGDHDRPSLLDGWTIAHLIAHVNSNARALVNLTVWARTGVETPMYRSNDQRAKDIEEGAVREFSYLVDDFQRSSRELSEAIASLTSDELDRRVKSAKGRDIPASEAVWIRIREVWIHAVDLGTGITFSRFPGPLLFALMEDVVPSLGVREGTPTLELVATDVSRTWGMGEGADAIRVEGAQSDLLRWLLGRSDGAGLVFSTPDGRAPDLPAWL